MVIVLNRLEQRRANQFCKKFYGQVTSTRGKKYRRIGLLDGIPHIKLARGVVIVSKKDAGEVIKFIQGFGGVEFHARDVVLTPQDIKALRGREV
ncbi:hypothetical protein [Candidatus Hadarchaeum sp.]|uniref:hypothetical protein n=1 Tax=Candidatus Hadarchaeum sp. TaxID=2883567 RepID=UPI003D0ACA5C